MESQSSSKALKIAANILSQAQNVFKVEGAAALIDIDILKQSLRDLYVLADEASIPETISNQEVETKLIVENEFEINVEHEKIVEKVEVVEPTREEPKPKHEKPAKESQKLKLKFVEPSMFDALEEQDLKQNGEVQEIKPIAEKTTEKEETKQFAIEEEAKVEANILIEKEIVVEPAPAKIEEPKIEQAPTILAAETPKEVKAEVKTEVKKSIHDMATSKAPEMTLADKMHQKSINSLKASIGINDKFQFINELFDGKMKDFNMAVEELDKLSNFREALDYISTFSKANNWNEESTVVEQFMSYLNRRFRQ